MAATWGEIFPHLMSAKLMATRGIKERLLAMDDPIQLLKMAEEIEIEGGMLTDEVLDKLITLKATKIAPPKVENFGRTIAPISQPEPVELEYRNNLPDWRQEDYPMLATDTDFDLSIHYDITGNSITEGKMGDIKEAFSNRLERLRKLIIQNSSLPRTPMEISRLHAERGRFQGRDNIAVAIGLSLIHI